MLTIALALFPLQIFATTTTPPAAIQNPASHPNTTSAPLLGPELQNPQNPIERVPVIPVAPTPEDNTHPRASGGPVSPNVKPSTTVNPSAVQPIDSLRTIPTPTPVPTATMVR